MTNKTCLVNVFIFLLVSKYLKCGLKIKTTFCWIADPWPGELQQTFRHSDCILVSSVTFVIRPLIQRQPHFCAIFRPISTFRIDNLVDFWQYVLNGLWWIESATDVTCSCGNQPNCVSYDNARPGRVIVPVKSLPVVLYGCDLPLASLDLTHQALMGKTEEIRLKKLQTTAFEEHLLLVTMLVCF